MILKLNAACTLACMIMLGWSSTTWAGTIRGQLRVYEINDTVLAADLLNSLRPLTEKALSIIEKIPAGSTDGDNRQPELLAVEQEKSTLILRAVSAHTPVMTEEFEMQAGTRFARVFRAGDTPVQLQMSTRVSNVIYSQTGTNLWISGEYSFRYGDLFKTGGLRVFHQGEQLLTEYISEQRAVVAVMDAKLL